MVLNRGGWGRAALIAVVASGLSVVATSVVVNAQAPDPEQIHACADARGTLRHVPATEACAPGESRVTWNADGPQGAAGPVGPAGPRGLQGPKGKKGKVKLNLGGDVGTQLILGRLKALDNKVTGLAENVSEVKKTVLYNKGYLKGHHKFLAGQMYQFARSDWWASYVACIEAGYLLADAGFEAAAGPCEPPPEVPDP